MKNPTSTEVHDLVARRWSPRAFSPEPIEQDVLERLVEAARWAPSSYNEQPWRFVIGDRAVDPEGHALLAAAVNDWNRSWAAVAPVLILVCAVGRFAKNGKENRHAAYDTGAAVAWLTAQATAEGLGVHQMGGFSADAARALNLPDASDPIAVLAIGRMGTPEDLPEELAKLERRTRTRLPTEQILFRLGR